MKSLNTRLERMLQLSLLMNREKLMLLLKLLVNKPKKSKEPSRTERETWNMPIMISRNLKSKLTKPTKKFRRLGNMLVNCHQVTNSELPTPESKNCKNSSDGRPNGMRTPRDGSNSSSKRKEITKSGRQMRKLD